MSFFGNRRRLRAALDREDPSSNVRVRCERSPPGRHSPTADPSLNPATQPLKPGARGAAERSPHGIGFLVSRSLPPRRGCGSPEFSTLFRERRNTTIFRSAAFADAARHGAYLRPDHHPAGERLPTERCDESARRGRLLEMMQRRPGRPAASVRPSIFVRSREAGAVASARSSAADSWRPRCPPPAGQQGDRSPTLSRRSPSSPFSVRSIHQRTRGRVWPVLTSPETPSAFGIDQAS